MFSIFPAILLTTALYGIGIFVTADCQSEVVAGFGTPGSCVRQQMKNTPVRIAYLDKQYVTQNQVAIDKVKSSGKNYTFGRTCESPATAVPEW